MHFFNFFLLPLAVSAVPATVLSSPQAPELAGRAAAVVVPNKDPFYSAPANLSAYKPGDIIRQRATPAGLAVFGSFPVPINSSTQLLYRTADANGNPQATVTTVIVPKNADLSKLLSYQIEYDSAWNGCNPSIVLQKGANAADSFGAYSVLIFKSALQKGIPVVTSDYEGPKAAFTSGKQAGHATLDSIRAALKSTSTTGIKPNAKLVMWGYSGGALATEWAAELQPTYAPELSFLGAAMGGLTPNISSVLFTINKGLFAGLAPTGVYGMAAAHPELLTFINANIIPSKKAAAEKVLSQCLIANTLQYAGQDVFSYFKNGVALLRSPIAQNVINTDGIMGVHGTPQFPLYVYKAVQDEVSKVAETDALVKKYCNAGVSIQYHRDPTGDHLTETIQGADAALAWVVDRFNGVPVAAGCFTNTAKSTFNDPANAKLFGPEIYKQLQAGLAKPVTPARMGLS